MKSVQEVVKYLKRKEKDAKSNAKYGRTKEDRAFYEGEETAYRDCIIQVSLLSDVILEKDKYLTENKRKLFMLGFILGVFLGGTLLTILTYIIINMI